MLEKEPRVGTVLGKKLINFGLMIKFWENIH